LRVYLSI